MCVSLTELLSQILSVLSSEAETSRLESEDHETSEIPYTYTHRLTTDVDTDQVKTQTRTGTLTSLCPTIDFSNFPSYAPQIFISLSAAVQTCYHGYCIIIIIIITIVPQTVNALLLDYLIILPQ